MADPVWDNGRYVLKNVQPKMDWLLLEWLAISYLSEKGMQVNLEEIARKGRL